jgi:RNA polymerase sigma factor (sigma-70 family)
VQGLLSEAAPFSFTECNDTLVTIVNSRPTMDFNKLVRDCLRNRPEAQRQLYEHFAETMLGVCYRYTKSIRDAEDILQEGFVKVFFNLKQYRNQGELGAWIRRIMVTTALNYLKRNRNYRDQMYFPPEHLHPVINEDASTILQAKEIAELIRQLPPGYQTIFNLHAIEGYSHVEIGELLGITDGTSRSQYARARGLLISWMKNYPFDKKMENYGGK